MILLLVIASLFLTSFNTTAQVPDPNQGLRASWMRGAVGLLWLPESCFNGNIEGVTIDPFITQINDLRAIDYVQVGLTNPNIYSPVHTAPNAIIESLWQGDVDNNGVPINLVVPRMDKADPFLSWLKALKNVGLKTEVYVNAYNLLDRIPESIPSQFPDVSARWKAYCDTNPTVQAYIKNNPYLKESDPVNRKYMFCYAEFILKDYAIRYGDLIDAWCFDSADNIMSACGDNAEDGILNDQRIYQAFADACHAGNPNAAIAFNNGTGERLGVPFSTATLFDDYSFGHPFGGAGNMVVPEILYDYNFHIVQFMSDTQGYSFRTDNRDWNDNVVGHFFPKQSTTSWNAGNTPCLTDAQFVQWNAVGLIDAGAITWGTPLVRPNLANSPILTLQPYAYNQFLLTDEYLRVNQAPNVPNWSRQATILPNAHIGIPYSHVLKEGYDFWDPKGAKLQALVASGAFPSWLSIAENVPGEFTLSGMPNEIATTDYNFSLTVNNATVGTERMVNLTVELDFNPLPITQKIQVIATATTNYGLNTIAKMYSATQTAPDGLATYKIAIDVKPTTGKAIFSGESGGQSTQKAWGIGETGTDTNNDDIFNGSNNEWVESIDNIQIVEFNANGGKYTLGDITTFFKSITIVNAQSTDDLVSLKVGNNTNVLGKLASQIETIDLNVATGIDDILSFAVGVGNDKTTNKWSVEGINVNVNFTDHSHLSVLETIVKKDIKLTISPNPAISEIQINIEPKAIQVFDLAGKCVKSSFSTSKNIDVSNLTSGIYLIKVTNSNDVVSFGKFIKQR